MTTSVVRALLHHRLCNGFCQRKRVLLLTAAALASGGAMAADTLGGLGAAFRPQARPAAPPVGAAASQPAGAAPSGLQLVLSGQGRALASIDGKLVRVGEVVNGMRVLSISGQGVILKTEDGTLARLSINPVAVRKTAPAAEALGTVGARP